MSDDLLADTFAMIEGRLSALELLVVASRTEQSLDEAAEFARRLAHLGSVMSMPAKGDSDTDRLISQYRTIALDRIAALNLSLAASRGGERHPSHPSH